jgi:NADPH-dependent curcumin reductase CurA
MHTLVPDSYDQRMHQFLKRMLRVYKMNKVPKTLLTLTNGLKSSTKTFFGPNTKKNPP